LDIALPETRSPTRVRYLLKIINIQNRPASVSEREGRKCARSAEIWLIEKFRMSPHRKETANVVPDSNCHANAFELNFSKNAFV